MSLSVTISLTGLCFDIFGSWFLANGLFKKTIEDIENETALIKDSLPYVFSGAIQKVDSLFGFRLLCIGFAGQALGYFIPKNIQTPLPLLWIVLVTLVFLAVLHNSIKIKKNEITRCAISSLKRIYINMGFVPDIDTQKMYCKYTRIDFKRNLSAKGHLEYMKRSLNI